MNYTAFQKIGLLPYQAAFAANTARFKIRLWARQTGKDHTATAEAVLDCLAGFDRRMMYNFHAFYEINSIVQRRRLRFSRAHGSERNPGARWRADDLED